MSSDTATARSLDSPQLRNGTRSALFDLLFVIASTVGAVMVTLIFNGRFFYADDTQSSVMGIWYAFGQRLLQGDFSYLDLVNWTSGNVLVEGQWGVLNPLLWLVSIGATLFGNLALYATVVKTVFMTIAAIGVYCLARSYGAERFVAIAVGCLVPLGGFTTYMDAASWATGLIVWSFLPWLWLALLKLDRREWGFLPSAGFSVLIVTVGYVHGTIMAGLLIGAFTVVAVIERRWVAVGRFSVVGILLILFTVPVFGPAILSAAVTTRASTSITSSGFWGPDFSDLLTWTALAPGVEIPNYSGRELAVPLFYVAWFLPLLALGFWNRIKYPEARVPALFTLLVLAFMMGPTEVGPLRYPVRVLPYWTLALLICLAVTNAGRFQHYLTGVSRSRRILLIGALPVIGTWLTWSDQPQRLAQQIGGLTLVLLALVLWLWQVNRSTGSLLWMGGLFVSLTLVLTAYMRWLAPSAPLSDYGLPTRVSSMQVQLPDVKEQTFVVGDLNAAPLPDLWSEALMARSWQVNAAPVQNSYSVISYDAYTSELRMNYLGMTPGSTLETLFALDETTRIPLVDLMGIQNVQIWRNNVPGRDLTQTPPGWSVSQEGEYTVLWSRQDSLPDVGEPSYTSAGVRANVISNTSDKLVLRVTNSGPAAGSIVTSRLAWPGYTVSGPVELVDPLRGYLQRISVPVDVQNAVVTVNFTPPGVQLGGVSAALAMAILAAAEFTRRRSTPSGGQAVRASRRE